MTKYATYDQSTKIVNGYYDDLNHEVIPKPNVEISEDEWKNQISEGKSWLYNGSSFEEYVYQPTLEERKETAIQRTHEAFNQTLVKLTGGASVEERDTWTIKENAARAFIAGNASDVQNAMLTAESNVTGETVISLAATIVAKADKYYQMVGLAAGMKRAAITAITACKTVEELDGVITSLETQRDQAIQDFMNGWKTGLV